MPEENKKLGKKKLSQEEFRARVEASRKDAATELEKAMERKESHDLAEAIANAKVGEMIAGQGIFLGRYSPKDRDGNSLGKIFNVFAAPQDLTDTSGNKATFKYVDAVKHIASLKNWNGFDGGNYADDAELYKALKSGSYNGEWVIPTRDLLIGTDVDGNNMLQFDNLYAHRNTGAFKDTFNTAASTDRDDFSDYYCSCTEHRDYPGFMWNTRFSLGYENSYHKDVALLSCRPVRLVPVPPPAG